ncbi:MAG TPA: hypothetical protein P5015_09365 [Candidatus Omnitrophota bacterium]|nr:hypothetical protein [Candidatus Omnitrophota bacterium]
MTEFKAKASRKDWRLSCEAERRPKVEQFGEAGSVLLPLAITFKPEGEGYRKLRKEWRLYFEANSLKVLRQFFSLKVLKGGFFNV